MKLRTIAEIQHKTPATNMDRSNTTGVLGTASVNNLFRKPKDKKPKEKEKLISPHKE